MGYRLTDHVLNSFDVPATNHSGIQFLPTLLRPKLPRFKTETPPWVWAVHHVDVWKWKQISDSAKSGDTVGGRNPAPVDQGCRFVPYTIDMFGNKATDGTYGSKYCFPGFGGLIQGQIYNPVDR